MPRIRKKTSNRQTTRDRAKIKNKVSEHHKKVKKGAKKDITWKSKKKADPGIPNSYPYKDKVLAELAEEKRQADEAKLARREANRNPNQHEPEDETPGIQSLHKSSVLSSSIALPVGKVALAALASAEAEADVPELIDTELTNLQDVLDKADVLIEVVDARDIAGGRCAWVEGLVEEAGGKVILVVTKIDLVPRESLESWISHLPPSTYLFSASPSGSTPVRGRAELLSALRSLPSSADSEPIIALMGLPNSGKTSLLNSLLSPTATKFTVAPLTGGNSNTAKHPEPTTKMPVEVRVDVGEGKGVRVIDTPGWELVEDDEDEEEEEEEEDEDEDKWDKLEERVAGDLLRRNLGRVDRVKDIIPLASYIISRSNAQDLMLAYNTPFYKEGDVEAFLTAVGRVNGRMRKHGAVDLDSAARIIVRDWAQGTFPYYSTPPKTVSTQSTKGRPDMSAVLATCKGRKEMRAGGKGLIRFRGGEVDTRQIVMDDDYTAMMGLSDEDDDEDVAGEDDDDEEDEEEEEEEEIEEPFGLASDEGDVLDLEDGPEPSSGSSVPPASDSESEQEEEIEPVETVSRKNKRKSLPGGSSPAHTDNRKKAKRVSFGRDVVGFGKAPAVVAVVASGKAGKGGKGAKVQVVKDQGGKDFKGLGKRRR